MREWRHLRLIATTSLLCASLAAFGCSDGKQTGTSSTGGSSTSSGGTGKAELSAAVTDITPIDATPDGAGDNVYVVGLDKDSSAVINQAKMDGSAPSTPLWTGDPLVSPLNIAASTDSKTLFIADPAAEDAADKLGRIFTIPATGGTLDIVTNADGYRARGLEIMSEDGKDMIFFAGTDPMGEAGIFKVPADNSGPVVPVASGGGMVDPSGVVVSANGAVYACDTVQDADGLGSVFSVKDGVATTIATGVRAGFPCGVSLSSDDSTLIVSALDPEKHTDTVVLINLSTNEITYFSDGIDTFLESAGLHRAKDGGNTYAWADSQAGETGTVFRVKLP